MSDKKIFKTLEEIQSTPWLDNPIKVGIDITMITPPPRQYGVYLYDLTINDIKLWETLYYKGGSVGIYGAWDPYSEFYILVYNLFLKYPLGIETFYGPGSVKRLYSKAKKLGIDLEISDVWVEEPSYTKFYDHFN